jgi:hypothetical protein
MRRRVQSYDPSEERVNPLTCPNPQERSPTVRPTLGRVVDTRAAPAFETGPNIPLFRRIHDRV